MTVYQAAAFYGDYRSLLDEVLNDETEIVVEELEVLEILILN